MRTRGWARATAASAGADDAQRRRLEGGDPHGARHGAPGQRRQLGLGRLRALEQLRGAADQRPAGVGEQHAAAGALEQRHAHLALEHRQLLGDGARGVVQRAGDRADGAPLLELAQEPQATEVEHLFSKCYMIMSMMCAGREQRSV